MTLAELKQKNRDVILDEMPWSDIPAIATGASVFYASLATSAKPKDQKGVRSAGHALTAGMTPDGGLLLVQLTKKNNTKLDVVYESNTGPEGCAALFRTRPMDAGDRRNLETWDRW